MTVPVDELREGDLGLAGASAAARSGSSVRAFFGMDLAELTQRMTALGQRPYRARQIFEGLYRQRADSFEQMTVLPAELRAELSAGGEVGLPEIAQTACSVDGTERYLMRMSDGETVETVWMPDGDGGERGDGSAAAEEEAASEPEVRAGYGAEVGKQVPFDRLRAGSRDARNGSKRGKSESNYNDELRGSFAALRMTTQNKQWKVQQQQQREEQRGRLEQRRGVLAPHGFRRATICVSSQVGCAVNCQFCLTAKLGLRRNLTAGEIAGQVAAVLNRHGVKVGRDRINLVFMGMGEPFLNYDAFMKAVRLLVEGVGIPESRMTVSTSGIEPAIRRFAMEAIRPKLALSLNASNDGVRERIMPITRKWGIAQLLEAVATIPLRTREWVTFEYVLLGGVNDRPEHAREVLGLLGGMRAKVNLIVWNPGPGIDYVQPEPEDVERFQKALIAGGIPTYIRRPRGRDIYAACGQLKRTVEPAGLVAIG